MRFSLSHNMHSQRLCRSIGGGKWLKTLLGLSHLFHWPYTSFPVSPVPFNSWVITMSIKFTKQWKVWIIGLKDTYWFVWSVSVVDMYMNYWARNPVFTTVNSRWKLQSSCMLHKIRHRSKQPKHVYRQITCHNMLGLYWVLNVEIDVEIDTAGMKIL